MHICSIKMDGWNITFESTRDLASAFLRLAETPTFLGLGIFPQMSLGEYKILYEDSDDEIVIKYSLNTVSIRAPWRSIQEGGTLLYAAFPFMELQRQRHGYVTVHAAAVSLGARVILILGKEGSGKTTTALGLCRSHGGRLIGNDLVVIGSANKDGKIMVHSGTKFLSLRYESIRRNMPDLLGLFPDKDEDPWLRKVLVPPRKANVDMCMEEVPLTDVFLVHVDETKHDFFVKSADTVITRLYLNENFSRYIRGTCVALLGEKLEYLGYVPSLDSEELFAKRVTLMERLLTEHSMKYISGSLERVVGHIISGGM